MKMVPCVSVVGVCVDLLSLLLAGCLRVPPAHTSPEPRRPKRPHGAVPPEGRTPDDSITSPSPAPPGAHHWSWICPQVGHHWSLRWPQVGHHSEAPPRPQWVPCAGHWTHHKIEVDTDTELSFSLTSLTANGTDLGDTFAMLPFSPFHILQPFFGTVTRLLVRS